MEAQEFCRFVWHIYLEKKDYQALENLLAPDLSVIGTGAHEPVSYTHLDVYKRQEANISFSGVF